MKQVELFLGRMQPIHNGHKQIIQKMKNPVVVIVKGAKSGNDAEKNPLDAEYQSKLLKMIFNDLEVSISPNGFLPGILGFLRTKKNMEVTKIYAGADRIQAYKEAIKKANDTMPEQFPRYNVTFEETERVTSATAVRDAIRKDDEETFKKLVPKEIWKEYKTLKDKLKQVKESKIFLSFQEWRESK